MENVFVKELKKTKIDLVVVETGYMPSIVTEITKSPGASAILKAAFTPYSKDSLEKIFGSTLPSNIRAVSSEYVTAINDLVKEKFNYPKLATVITSFQLPGSNDTEFNANGYVFVSCSGFDYITHVQFPFNVVFDREFYSKEIANIALEILYSLAMVDYQGDINLTLKGTISTIAQLTYISSNVNHVALLPNTNNVLLLDTDTGYSHNPRYTLNALNDVVLFKGSFNPPTINHEIMVKSFENCIPVISLNTHGKGTVDLESCRNRLEAFKGISKYVMFVDNGYFTGLNDILINLGVDINKISYLIGEDVVERLLVTTPLFRIKELSKIIVTRRQNVSGESVALNTLKAFHPNVVEYDVNKLYLPDVISSTMMRTDLKRYLSLVENQTGAVKRTDQLAKLFTLSLNDNI